MQKILIQVTIALFCTVAVSSSAAFAETQVIIPPGASIQTNPFSLSPTVLNVKINDTVTWQNQDSAVHTVTTGTTQYGYDGRFDSGPIEPGKTFSYKFGKAGTYQYFCIFHPWMTGVVNVSDASSVEPAIAIDISADRSSYKMGDTIQVSGTVSQFIPNEIVTIWVEDNHGETIATKHVETESGKAFETSIPISNTLWIPGTTYMIFGQYGSRSDVAESKIMVEPISKPQESKPQTTSKTDVTDTSSYPGTYKEVDAGQDNYITVQTGHHAYFPGQEVSIAGSIWAGMFQQVGGAAYLVTAPTKVLDSNSMSEVIGIQVLDPAGKSLLNQSYIADGNGQYNIVFNIPQDAKVGEYTIYANIEAKEGLLDSLEPSVAARLGSHAVFEVAEPSQFVVRTNTGGLVAEIGSNSTVANFKFNSTQKSISFTVEGKSGTDGVALVTIPNALLGGQLQAFIDGKAQPYGSGNVIAISGQDMSILEINYHHSIHTIEIVGTKAAGTYTNTSDVPEFSAMSPVILAIAIISTVIISSKARYYKDI